LNTAFRHVALDIETTGLSPQRGHRIIEIGAVSIEKGCIKDEFCSLVRIDRKIGLHAQRVHGITDKMLRDQPRLEDVLPKFHMFLRDSVVVAHNARFDMEFLRCEFERISLDLNNRYICTLEMSRKLYTGLPNHKLETVYRHLIGKNVAHIQMHRALDDARMAADIWLEMVKSSPHMRG